GSGSGGASSGNGSAGNGGSGSGGASSGNGSAGNGGSGSGGASSGNGSAGSGSGGSGGHVQPDGGACTQDPNLQGTWNMTQDYELSKGLTAAIGGVVQAINDIDQLMQLIEALGTPIPSWVNTLMSDLLNLQYLLSEMDVNGTLVLVNGSDSMTYTATEQWQNVVLKGPNNLSAGLSPNQDGGSGYFYFTSPPPYTVTTCSGTATFDQHDLEGALSGIIPPLLDEITQIATCTDTGPCYATFQQAIAAMIDCQQFTPVPDAGPAKTVGSSCQQDSDCNACAVGGGSVCNQGACALGCRNDYDCGEGWYCNADAGCKPAPVLATGTTPTSGQTSGPCSQDSDCNGGTLGTGTFCYFPHVDGGLAVNDAGQFVGNCLAGCDNNYACVQADVCSAQANGSNILQCFTVDTSQVTPLNQQDTGCNGPNEPQAPDAGQSPATQLCNSVQSALVGELTTFLSNLTFNFGVASVEGVCTVSSSTSLTNGQWTGDIVFVPIGGHFHATETSTSVP
ncbi:MAG: hypothetical protein ACYDCL_21920, partial [Myxococcales bacterium]